MFFVLFVFVFVCLFIVVVLLLLLLLSVCVNINPRTPSTGYDILPPRRTVSESDARSVHKDKKLRYI